MVAIGGDSNGPSFYSPLLGDRVGENGIADFNSIYHGEVAVAIDKLHQSDERYAARHSLGGYGVQSGLDFDDLNLEAESRSTFQHIHELSRQRSTDYGKNQRSKLSCRSIRNPIRPTSLVTRAACSAKANAWNFLYNVIVGLYMWPKWCWDAMKANSNLTIISAKQGVCSGLASILCVIKFPEPFTQISSIALWAVVTTDLLYEGNIGLSISKGFNRVLGTLAAGLIGFGLNQIGPELGPVYPYFVVFFVTVGGGVFKFFKGIPPLKDQWGYAFTVATVAFHIFIITDYLDPERWTLPILRFAMILLGFAMASITNIALKPNYAGDALHKLVAKNFETAATVIQRCVEEYNKDTKLDHIPDILSGRSEDDKIHQSYHEIVMSDLDIDKLLSAVHWEPSHGKFFLGYPWDLYDNITDYLRYTLYDIIALDLSLRANIQAPKHLRDLFAEETATIATECATVFRTLGDSIKNMKKFQSEDIMKRAEEAAIELQFKIYLHTNDLLGDDTSIFPMPSPRSHKHQAPGNWLGSNLKVLDDSPPNPIREGDISASFGTSRDPDIGSPRKGLPRGRSGPVKKISLETLTEGVPSVNGSVKLARSATSEQLPKKSLAWQQTFLHRKSSLGSHWDGSLERISAVSLVKYASLLIEVVSKMKYVVNCVEDLGEQARFQDFQQAER